MVGFNCFKSGQATLHEPNKILKILYPEPPSTKTIGYNNTENIQGKKVLKFPARKPPCKTTE